MSQFRTQTPHRNSRIFNRSPRSRESPSHQALLDLERSIAQINLHESEKKKVEAFNRRSYIEGLDAHELACTHADIAAIEANAARHDAVRHEAEVELQQYLAKVEEARRKKEEEEARLRREKEAQEKAEREEREREEAEKKARIEKAKAAAAKKAAEEKAKAEAEEARRKEREEAAAREKAEKARLAKEAAEKSQAEKAAADEKASKEAAAQKDAEGYHAAAQSLKAASTDLENVHNGYLALHKKLKKFRADFVSASKKDPKLKPIVGEMRRDLRKCVGQLTDDKSANRKPTDAVKGYILDSYRKISSPPVLLADYLPFTLAEPKTTIPSLTLYLLTNFAKAVISAFVGECAVNPRAAEPVGTIAAHIFSLPELQFPLPNPTNKSPATTTSLIAILTCKYHAICPALFGISTNDSAPPDTTKGRLRIGWGREVGPTEDKVFVSEQKHLERMTGLGAGFASIALRNFSKTRLTNPYPPSNFWAAVSSLVTTPPAHVSAGHLVLLKNMLEGGWERIILFWGDAGVALLREGCIDWPSRLPREVQNSAPGRGLGLMADLWEKEKDFRLN